MHVPEIERVNPVTLTVDGDGIALLAMNVAGRPMNLLTPQLRGDLAAAIEKIAADAAIRGAVLTSAKPGSFMAGADLKDLVTAYDRGITAAEARDIGRAFQQLIRRMETCGKPFAAAINGMALGGGLELALGCHYRVLADHPKAVVGLPEVTVGLLPAGGGTQRLPRLIGVQHALPLLLNGNHVAPSDALRLGIVHALAQPEDCVATARAWLLDQPSCVQPWDRKGFVVPGGAGPLAAFASQSFMVGAAQIRKQTHGNLPAPLAILSCTYEGTITGFDAGLRIEANYFGKLLSGPVARNLMRSGFVNRSASRLPVPESYARRLLAAFIEEGVRMLDEGVEPALIENSARRAGMQLGPLGQFDAMPREQTEAVHPALFQKMSSLGRTGPGKGFYEYDANGARQRLWPQLREHFAVQAQQPPVDELTLRFLTIQSLEAARCMEEGLLTDPADADLGSIRGSGFPSWTGGALSYIETVGLPKFVRDCERLTATCGDRYRPSTWLSARAASAQPFYPQAQVSAARPAAGATT